MFILLRKMLKILYQLCTSVRNVVYITAVYVDAIKILGAHMLYLPFYSVPFFTSLNLLAKILKAIVLAIV